jgi:hypothetical protein
VHDSGYKRSGFKPRLSRNNSKTFSEFHTQNINAIAFHPSAR